MSETPSSLLLLYLTSFPARDLKPDKVGEVRTRGLKLTVIVPPYSDLRSGFTAPCGLPNQTAVINSLPTSSYFHSFARTRQSKGGGCAQAIEFGTWFPWVRRLTMTRTEKKSDHSIDPFLICTLLNRIKMCLKVLCTIRERTIWALRASKVRQWAEKKRNLEQIQTLDSCHDQLG